MKIDIWNYITSSIGGFILAIVFSVLGMLFLSEKIVWSITKKIKPQIKESICSVFINISNVLVNNKYTYLGKNEEKEMKKMEKINIEQSELKKIEENLFIIDSLIGMFEMLSFIVYKGFKGDEIYETVFEYFACYCKSINEIGDKNLRSEIQFKFDKFNYDLGKYIDEDYGEEEENFINSCKRAYKIRNMESDFKDFLKRIKDEQNKQLEDKKKSIIKNVDRVLEEI
ncbi:hypothetical protein [Clostridium butyricum]|uniref:hypothetical protein n=1 Tax=Clostridium butyricum TaxID=1492 RepID=UPI0018AB65AD|nr:hypothetical protein [Clostridium butyricum]